MATEGELKRFKQIMMDSTLAPDDVLQAELQRRAEYRLAELNRLKTKDYNEENKNAAILAVSGLLDVSHDVKQIRAAQDILRRITVCDCPNYGTHRTMMGHLLES